MDYDCYLWMVYNQHRRIFPTLEEATKYRETLEKGHVMILAVKFGEEFVRIKL